MPTGTGRVVAGRYTLRELIGQGAMGVVWRAHDRLLDRPVAVKEVRLSPAIGDLGQEDPYQRTLDEARNAARLNHPGIVTVFDVVEEDGRPWIVMELIPSTSLEEVIAAEGPMTEPRAARMGSQLLAALSAAHDAGVLHRDVKPGNVLIAPGGSADDPPERAVLTDFGISRLESDPRRTLAGLVVGSPGYVAPERLSGDDATPASDLWSLGATLYAAVEGRGPFERRNVLSTQFATVNEDPPPASSAGRLAPVIAALLRREPAARPSAAETAAMIAQLLPQAGDLVSTAAPTVAEPVRPVPSGERIRTAPDAPLSGTQTLDRARLQGRRSAGRVRLRPMAQVAVAVIVVAAIAVGVAWSLRTRVENLREDSAGGSAAPTTTANGTAPTAGVLSDSSAPPIVKAIDQPGALPAGFTAVTVPAPSGGSSRGFRIGLPTGWRGSFMGQELYQYTPNGGQTYLEIDLSKHFSDNMVAEATRLAAQHNAVYPGYQLIYGQGKKFVQPADILQTAGALWQFDWLSTTDHQTVEMRVDELLFNLGQQSYTITMTGPAGSFDANWNTNLLPIMTNMLHTFRSST